jgi:hypothetical protein
MTLGPDLAQSSETTGDLLLHLVRLLLKIETVTE